MFFSDAVQILWFVFIYQALLSAGGWGCVLLGYFYRPLLIVMEYYSL